MHVLNKSLLTLLSASVLLGCSALDDLTNDDDEDVATTSLSGKVADGYLAGARVCLDLNSNKVCDEGEPSTTSTAGGEFSLAGVTQAQLDSAPLLVEVVVGETIDEDNPGTFIDKKYTLTAPAGYAFISPLTTMVQSEIEDNGLSPEDAEGSVQAKLGTTLDLEADYVAGSDGGDDAAEFERLHKVAQVTVVVLQNNIELVEDVLAGAEVSFEDLVGMIVAQVLVSLDTISEGVATAGDDFDPDTVADSDAVSDANVDAATIADDIAEREAARQIATANIAAILGSGESIHIFKADAFDNILEFGYETITKISESSISFLFFGYDSESDSWVAEEDSSEETSDNELGKICILNNSSWDCQPEESDTVTIEGDAVIVKVADIASSRTEITGVSVDLDGKRIATFLENDFFKVIDPSAHFSSGATGYKLTFKRTLDMHAIFNANAAAVTDCWQGHENSQAIQAGQPFNPTDTWCNNVFIRTGDGNHATDGVAATSFADIISATAVVNPAGVEHIKGTTLYGRNIEIMAEFVTGGVANYYLVKHAPEQAPIIEDKIVGRWEEKTIEGKALLLFTLPSFLSELGDFSSDERAQFFTVEDNALRRGGIAPAGDSGDREWVYNDAARDQIKTAFNYDLIADLAVCTTGDTNFDNESDAENLGATAAQFVTFADGCADIALIAADLEGTTLVTDFGFLSFEALGSGTFLGEIGDDEHAVLDFTWSVNTDGHLIVNTQKTEEGETTFLRLTIAKIAENPRQMSVKTFNQEASSSAELETATGEIFSELWGIN